MTPPFAVRTEAAGALFKKLDLAVVKRRPTSPASQRIDLKAYGEAQFIEKKAGHCNDLGVYLWVVRANHLHAHLMKLPQTPLLRPFMSKHGTHGIKPLNRTLDVKAMFYERPQDRCRAFRPHGD